MKISNFNIGDKAQVRQKITKQIIKDFSVISKDTNPIHLDNGYAKKTIFKKNIAHGLLVASYISSALGTKIPGPGAIYLSQNLLFIRPVFIDDEITAEVEIISIRKSKNIITLRTTCFNQKQEEVISGEAVLKII
ncbi:MaoC family dehydratase [Candidatus Marinimicrobia bacterium]|nr:MaoC family dehydratase [Candidatus Neomarinimicrobiota bacterium]